MLIEKKIEISPNQLGFIQHLLSSNGMTSCRVFVDQYTSKANLIFEDDAEYMIFLLRGLVQVLKQNSNSFGELNLDFMIEVEKKFGSYSSMDEHEERKLLSIM